MKMPYVHIFLMLFRKSNRKINYLNNPQIKLLLLITIETFKRWNLLSNLQVDKWRNNIFIWGLRSVRTSCFNSGVLSSFLCTMCSSLSAPFRDGLLLHPSLLQQGFLYDITNGDMKVGFKEPVCTCDLSIWQILIQYPGVPGTAFGSCEQALPSRNSH